MPLAHDTASPPQKMGRYEILFRIAAGGMAEVFAARVHGEAGFEKLVAVKRMLSTLADDDEFVSMFLDEARLAANISSPHVVQTLDLGRDDTGCLYLAMELVVGVTLSRIFKEASKVRRAVPVPMAVELLAQAADGLHAAHTATTPVGLPLHIVHRDVSPQNILVGVDGRARLTDFGVARAVLRSTKTDAGRIKGKFAYCSPEQLRSDEVDQRADIFALGVVAWEVLAGQRLFVADHPLATMERVTSMPILALDSVRSKVPKAVANVVERALQRNPEQRFPSAHEFAVELRRAAELSGLERPRQAEISQFVKAAGGEPLRKMRSNIQQALKNGTVSDAHAIEDVASLLSSSATLDTGIDRPLEQVTEVEPDASGVARVPSSLFPGHTPAPPPPAKSDGKHMRWAAIALGFGVIVGVGVALASIGGDDTNEEDINALAPQVPAARPASEPEEDEAPLDLIPAGELQVEVPEDESARDEVEGEAALSEDDAAESEGDAAEEAGSTRTRTRTRPTRTRNSAAEQEAEDVSEEAAPPPVAMVERSEAPAPVPAATMRTEPSETSSMRGPLVGVEQFDQELNQR